MDLEGRKESRDGPAITTHVEHLKSFIRVAITVNNESLEMETYFLAVHYETNRIHGGWLN